MRAREIDRKREREITEEIRQRNTVGKSSSNKHRGEQLERDRKNKR